MGHLLHKLGHFDLDMHTTVMVNKSRLVGNLDLLANTSKFWIKYSLFTTISTYVSVNTLSIFVHLSERGGQKWSKSCPRGCWTTPNLGNSSTFNCGNWIIWGHKWLNVPCSEHHQNIITSAFGHLLVHLASRMRINYIMTGYLSWEHSQCRSLSFAYTAVVFVSVLTTPLCAMKLVHNSKGVVAPFTELLHWDGISSRNADVLWM